MKKFFFIAAIASAALVSCTKNEAVQLEQNEISFNKPIVGPQTKAPQPGEIDGNTYPDDERFNVYAVWHLNDFQTWDSPSSLYMHQVECGYDTDSWKPVGAEGKYYWPKEGKLTFAAYSPADMTADNITYGKTGLTVEGFVPAAETVNQFDFLYAERTYDQVEANYVSSDPDYDASFIYKGVDLKFRHALSQVVFKFKSDVAGVIDLQKVTITNAQAKGTFNENVDETVAGYKSSPSWSFTGFETEKCNYNIYTQTTQDLLTTTDVEKNNSNADCIILPQTLEGVKLLLEYRIKRGNSAEFLPQTTEVTLSDKKDTGANIIASWDMAKRYTYTINITLDEIYFDPAVVDWVDVNMLEIVK